MSASSVYVPIEDARRASFNALLKGRALERLAHLLDPPSTTAIAFLLLYQNAFKGPGYLALKRNLHTMRKDCERATSQIANLKLEVARTRRNFSRVEALQKLTKILTKLIVKICRGFWAQLRRRALRHAHARLLIHVSTCAIAKLRRFWIGCAFRSLRLGPGIRKSYPQLNDPFAASNAAGMIPSLLYIPPPPMTTVGGRPDVLNRGPFGSPDFQQFSQQVNRLRIDQENDRVTRILSSCWERGQGRRPMSKKIPEPDLDASNEVEIADSTTYLQHKIIKTEACTDLLLSTAQDLENDLV